MSEVFFESIKVQDGKIFHLSYHQDRIYRTINKRLNLQGKIKLYKALTKCKLIYSKEGIHKIEYAPYTKKTFKSFKVIKSDIIYDRKYLHRGGIDTLYGLRGHCDDVLIVHNDLLKDTSIANVALFVNGTWLTPKEPLLKGTCRARLIKEGFLKEHSLVLDDIKKASCFGLLNSMMDFDQIKGVSFEYH